jgi:hypothetical protein
MMREISVQQGAEALEFHGVSDGAPSLFLTTSTLPTKSPPPPRVVPKAWRDALVGSFPGVFARTQPQFPSNG